jgi:hypothetical protein
MRNVWLTMMLAVVAAPALAQEQSPPVQVPT